MLTGGLRHGTQIFDKRSASRNAIMLVLAVVALDHSVSVESGHWNTGRSKSRGVERGRGDHHDYFVRPRLIRSVEC